MMVSARGSHVLIVGVLVLHLRTMPEAVATAVTKLTAVTRVMVVTKAMVVTRVMVETKAMVVTRVMMADHFPVN